MDIHKCRSIAERCRIEKWMKSVRVQENKTGKIDADTSDRKGSLFVL